MLNLGKKLCLWRKLEHVVMKVTLIPGGGGGGDKPTQLTAMTERFFWV